MLSIIIPTLNEENYLEELIQSLHCQSFKDYEIIVSDGGSEDRTREIAKRYNCQIVLGDKERRHPSIQRNNGARVARGDILFFLDADTRIPNENFLNKSLKEFGERSLGVASFYLKFDSNKFFYKFYYCFYTLVSFLAQRIKPVGIGAAIIIKKNIHEEIGGFREDLFIGEDQYYCEQAAKISKFRMIRGGKIFFSIRRFEKNGRWKTFFKILRGGLYVLFRGPIKKNIFKYDFGNHQ